MGMTISEKILAIHSGLKKVIPGQIINAKIDLLLANDITAPVAIDEFEKSGIKNIFNRNKICLIPDHFAPNKDIKSAEQINKMRKFSRKHKIKYFFEIGKMGIEHCLLPELGLISPGNLIVGADSHTCTHGALGAFATGVGSTDIAAAMINGKVWLKVPETIKFTYKGKLKKWVGGKDIILYTIGKIGVDGARYMSMEFSGEIIDNLSMDNRFTLTNMAIESGAKNGIIPVDKITMNYIKNRIKNSYSIYKSDINAKYKKHYEWNLSNLEPQVAFPHSPENTKNISEVGTILIDQVVIGSCTNGRLEDLKIAASILKNKKINKNIRVLVFPGTQNIYLKALKEGIIEILINSGAIVSTPTCGPCLGGHMGILGKGEVALSTTNRNFKGRMGSPYSKIYLCNPAVAAASAIAGKIISPEEVI